MHPFYEQRQPAWLVHQDQLDFPLHLHNAIELVYVVRGSSMVLYDSGRYALGPGDLFLSFPNQVHGYENTRDFDGYVLIATTQLLSSSRTMLEQNQPRNPICHPTGQAAADILALLKMLHVDRKSTNIPLLKSYSLLLLHKAVALTGLTPRTRESDTLQLALRYIGEHYREPLTRGHIAKAVGYSESHLSHLFTDRLHISLTDYITKLRMDDAQELLRSTDLPVGQIAMSLGFSSIRSFNRFFLMDTGITPTAYRSQEAET